MLCLFDRDYCIFIFKVVKYFFWNREFFFCVNFLSKILRIKRVIIKFNVEN